MVGSSGRMCECGHMTSKHRFGKKKDKIKNGRCYECKCKEYRFSHRKVKIKNGAYIDPAPVKRPAPLKVEEPTTYWTKRFCPNCKEIKIIIHSEPTPSHDTHRCFGCKEMIIAT